PPPPHPFPTRRSSDLVYEPPPYDPALAKKLLAEAGYPSGFDAGDLTPFPPFFSMGEALVTYLQSVGIRTRLRTMERAAFLSAWRDRKSTRLNSSHGSI